jgi:hypothetical protein
VSPVEPPGVRPEEVAHTGRQVRVRGGHREMEVIRGCPVGRGI